jgi:hypothetical protein
VAPALCKSAKAMRRPKIGTRREAARPAAAKRERRRISPPPVVRMAAGEWGARTPWGLRPPPHPSMFASRSCGAAPEAKVAVAVAVRSASFGGQVRAGREELAVLRPHDASAIGCNKHCWFSGLIVSFLWFSSLTEVPMS